MHFHLKISVCLRIVINIENNGKTGTINFYDHYILSIDCYRYLEFIAFTYFYYSDSLKYNKVQYKNMLNMKLKILIY